MDRFILDDSTRGSSGRYIWTCYSLVSRIDLTFESISIAMRAATMGYSLPLVSVLNWNETIFVIMATDTESDAHHRLLTSDVYISSFLSPIYSMEIQLTSALRWIQRDPLSATFMSQRAYRNDPSNPLYLFIPIPFRDEAYDGLHPIFFRDDIEDDFGQVLHPYLRKAFRVSPGREEGMRLFCENVHACVA